MAEHSEIIDRLGGGTALSDALAGTATPADREAVYAWKIRNRIPSDYWPSIVAVAEEHDIALTLQDFYPAPKRKSRGRGHKAA